jgi:ribosomal protein S18 acetylase RimI-like enzyme
MEDAIAVRMLADGDRALLLNAVGGVFDRAVDPALADAFLADPRHHFAAAIDGERLVGMVSAVDYWHPDKPRELFINEVGVAAGYRRRGIGQRLMRTMLDHGRSMGCRDAWVMTDAGNAAANRLYARAGDPARDGRLVMYTYAFQPGPDSGALGDDANGH